MTITYFLEGEDIALREFRNEDVQRWTSWFNNPDVTRSMNKGMFPVLQEEQMQRFENLVKDKSSMQLAIIHKEPALLIGTIGLHKIDWIHRTADISIVIGETEGQGKGYGKQAIEILVYHAFKKLNLRKLTSGMWSCNKGSEAAFKANGFVKEGCRKQQYYYLGEYVDELNYGLLRSEWEKSATGDKK